MLPTVSVLFHDIEMGDQQKKNVLANIVLSYTFLVATE